MKKEIDNDGTKNENQGKKVIRTRTIRRVASSMEFKGDVVQLKEVKRTPTLPSVLPSSSSMSSTKKSDFENIMNTSEENILKDDHIKNQTLF